MIVFNEPRKTFDIVGSRSYFQLGLSRLPNKML